MHRWQRFLAYGAASWLSEILRDEAASGTATPDPR
jgi:hypothetical protein